LRGLNVYPKNVNRTGPLTLVFWAGHGVVDACILPNCISSVGSPSKHGYKRRALEARAKERRALELRLVERRALELRADERRALELRLVERRALELRADELRGLELRVDERRALELCALLLWVGVAAFELCAPQVCVIELRALELHGSEICFPELGADQHRAFEMAGAKGDGFGNRRDLCFAVEFGVVDRVESRQHEPVRPKTCWLAGGKIDVACDQQLVHGRQAPWLILSVHKRQAPWIHSVLPQIVVQPFAWESCNRNDEENWHEAREGQCHDLAAPQIAP
jgi:hypothetical protein